MKQYNIPKRNKEIGKQVKQYIDTLTKPIGSLGRLEELAIELAEMKNENFPSVEQPGILVFAADHGVTAQGVSAYPQEVTEQMVHNFLTEGAAINVFSRQIGAKLEIIDIGVAVSLEHAKLINKKIRYGTADFFVEDAMSRDEAKAAIEVGYVQAKDMIQKGINCLILGEMGIGNTTSSSAIVSFLGDEEVDAVVGMGTGISSEQLQHKGNIIKQAIEKRNPNSEDPIDVLSKIGGLEIAGMAGAMIAAAENRTPILVDGFICTTAVLVAKELAPHVVDYIILAHKSSEPGHAIATSLLKKKPLIDLHLRLGEGTGAAIAYPIVQSATLMLKEMATFTSAGVSTKT